MEIKINNIVLTEELLKIIPDLNLQENYFDLIDQEIVNYLKSGGKIYIKPKNRGKFTASAKRAGKSVQEHAKDVLNDPNATPLQKKRANFARNAAKWHKK